MPCASWDSLPWNGSKAAPALASLPTLEKKILACRRCPRLVRWREESATKPPLRFAGQHYFARPVPGFGDPEARILVVGLAPAAHGANRTGRMFTGDRSGDWLYGALHRAGFANQARADALDDGLRLNDVFITAVCRCAPPDNKPTREEAENCGEFLEAELEFFWPRLRVIVTLGGFALTGTLRVLARRGITLPRPRPKFGHARIVDLGAKNPKIVMSYHPSQQNTFTGRLTRPMFDTVWEKARKFLPPAGG